MEEDIVNGIESGDLRIISENSLGTVLSARAIQVNPLDLPKPDFYVREIAFWKMATIDRWISGN